MSLIQFAVIRRYKGLRNELYFLGDANIFVGSLLVMKLTKTLQRYNFISFEPQCANDIREGTELMIFYLILL
jgi:hypothetical protein